MVYLLRRFASWYFDVIVIILISVLAQLLMNNYGEGIVEKVENPSAEHWIQVQLITMFIYYFFVELIFKRTVGKMLFKFQIEGLVEKSVTKRFIKVLIRTISRFIPFEPFSIFLDEEKRMWHDKLSKTKVLDLRKRN